MYIHTIMSKSRKSKRTTKVILPHPTPGALGDYTTHDSQSVRRKELEKHVKKIGYASTVRDLNLRATLNKSNAPDASEKMRDDMAYLKKKYRGGSRKSRKSRKSNKSRKTFYCGIRSKSGKIRQERESRKSRKSRK